MVLRYIPLDIYKCCNKYKLDVVDKLNSNLLDYFGDIYNSNFCKYQLIKGKNKGFICGNKTKDMEYCKKHINKNILNVDKVYCKAKSRRKNKCGRLIKDNEEYCIYHKKTNTNEKIEKNKSLVLTKIKIISHFILLYNSVRKNKNIDLNKYKKINCIELIKKLNYNYSIEGSTYRIKFNNFNIVLTNNLYFDNATGVGGKGILDLYMHITSKSLQESIKELEKINIFVFPTSNIDKNKLTSEKLKNNKSLVKQIPKENINNIDIVKKYLTKERKINEKLICNLIEKGRISADDNKNCIFFDINKTFAHLRGTKSKRFFCSIGISNIIEFKYKNDPLYIFEGPIDILSYLSIYNNYNGNFISTNGEMLINKIETIVKRDNIKEIHLCLDNDDKGEDFVKKIKDNLINYNILFIREKTKFKDWNEYLCSQ